MTDERRNRKFGLFFEGFSLEEVKQVLEQFPDTTPTSYFDDDDVPFPILAAYSTAIPPERIQQFVKEKLDYRPPTDRQIEELGDFDDVRAFART
ncbi:hypothetical protein [Trueperella abortisuis]|uniref:DNA-binding transcriptional MerR regulator n=1 Tax=Trueperella abortisuis TaxID=445930 RepID=A0ABT9PH80_9ACTO|nr:hypothetical protein [Trueperella abortisuis]MDP9832076.1 DNA-binding transcriptional MerR regulator [Trueperella abortisuis]